MKARVSEIDSFEDLPGVGVGQIQSRGNDTLPWMAALAMACGLIVALRVRLGRR